MTEHRFYVCEHCGNLVGMIHNSGVPIICCGEEMKELIPGSVDAAVEKHVPSVSVSEGKVFVQIGGVAHPMEESHFIEWIYLQTECGGHRKNLKPGMEPKRSFTLDEEKPVAVYAFCNKHGLWKTEIES